MKAYARVIYFNNLCWEIGISPRSPLYVFCKNEETRHVEFAKKKEENQSDLHRDRAKILSTENFSPAARHISHASLDRPQDIRFLTRVVRDAVEATTKEEKHEGPPITKG